MITTSSLHKRFGSKVAVEDVTFTAEDGAVTGILGPNGAGKTTSLRMLYGLIRPDRGSAQIDGLDVMTEPIAARHQLGVLPDSPGLYGRLTGREHLNYAGELLGMDRKEIRLASERLAEIFDMREILDRRCAGFSQGERRKVALARALIHDPRNVVLDEPANGLDVMSRRGVRRAVRQLAESGKCVLFSSHMLQEVAAVCDRVVIIAVGRVVADGTPGEILERTGADDLENAFVQLIGTEGGSTDAARADMDGLSQGDPR